MRLPLDRCRAFFDRLRLRAPLDEATALLLAERSGGTSSADQGLQQRAPVSMVNPSSTPISSKERQEYWNQTLISGFKVTENRFTADIT